MIQTGVLHNFCEITELHVYININSYNTENRHKPNPYNDNTAHNIGRAESVTLS